MALPSFGGSASGFGRDLNICAHTIGIAKKKLNNGDRTGASTDLGTVISDLTTLKATLDAATAQKDLDTLPTLRDPVWGDGI